MKLYMGMWRLGTIAIRGIVNAAGNPAIFFRTCFWRFALAHNGNLTNAARLRASLVKTGSLFQSSSDTEIIVHLVARSHQDTVIDD